MKIIDLSESEAYYYCTREEGHFFDRKAVSIKGSGIQKIAVAFANADGGEFVIGIDDEKSNEIPLKRWNGQDSTEKYNGALQALSELNPSVDFRFDLIRIKDRYPNYVLRVFVNKGLQIHKTASDDVYVRVGAQSLPVKSPVKILELSHAKGIKSAEDILIKDASIDELESSKHLATFLGQLQIEEPDAVNFLLQERLIDQKTWTPKMAAVLLFLDNPSSVLPGQCGIRVVRYDTHVEDIDRDALTKDNYIIEGALYDQIYKAHNKIEKVLENNVAWTVDGVQPTRYPKDAIWEVLVNSVLHRDYSISDNVLVSVFRNRIEFKSPGRFPGFVTADNILDNRFSRNSKIVRLLAQYREAPNRELGEGMNTAFKRMRDAGLLPPEVIEDGNYVKVIFRHVPMEEPETLLINFLKKHHTINNRQALDVLGLDSSDKVTALFVKMRTKGSIKRVESTSGTGSQWQLSHA